MVSPEGDRVLDLCAAPGGKTTQLGARLGGTGLLVANDISAGRAKTLLKNVELAGIRNAIVMSETPERIAERLPHFFDKILVDAPCSGEGMFRKEPDMVKSWDADMLAFCRREQAKILEACAPMLKAGGMLLYSTCTFSPEENEKSIGDFLERHPEFQLVPIEKKNGFAAGLPPYTDCARLYPHRLKGEGHFLALLRKKEAAEGKAIPAESGGWTKEMDAFGDFAKEVLQEKPKGTYKIYGEGLYLLPEGTPKLEKLRVLRTGWMLGTLKKGRFEPSQAFAMGLRKEEVLETPGFAYDRVPVKGIVVSEGASASVGNGDVLNFSNPERRARITVTSRSGHRLDWWIYLETYDPFFLGTWRIVDVKLACNQRVSGVGDGAWTTQLSSGEFGTYGLPEYDDRVTITLGEISDNELTGTLVHSAGDDGAYGNFWGVYAPYSVEAPLDMNPRLRHLLPPGESQWTLDLTTNQMKITQNNVSSTMIFGTLCHINDNLTFPDVS